MISTSRDYLIMESLLTLFARLLSTGRVVDGGSTRTQFVQETLGSSELFKCSEELVRILHEASTSDWNTIATQLITALAKSDITYPQPFSVKEINACGHVFPQPDASDRLLLDRQGFLANVILPMDDVCDSLMVPYGHIQTVNVDTPATAVNAVVVVVGLSSAPKIGNTALKVDNGEFCLTFSLGREDLSRFMETLRRRGIGKLTFNNPAPRARKPKKSISLASEVKFASDSSLPPPTADFQEKVKRVEEVYKTAFDDLSSEPAAVSFTPSDPTCNQFQNDANFSRRVTMKLFATGDVGQPDRVKQDRGNSIPKKSSAPREDSGDQVPQEDSYSPTTSRSRCFKEGCRSDEGNCKAPVFSNPASGETSRIRPHKRVHSPGNDIVATNMSYGGKNSVATKAGDNDTGEVQVITTSLNEQLSEITPQPGTDLGSEVFEANIGGEAHHAPISPIAPYGPVTTGQDGQVIGASQPEHLVYIKQSMTPPRNRPPKQSLNSALAMTRLNKRKIQEMTQHDSTTDACKLDEEHGPYRKSQKRVGRVPPNSRRTTESRSIFPGLCEVCTETKSSCDFEPEGRSYRKLPPSTTRLLLLSLCALLPQLLTIRPLHLMRNALGADLSPKCMIPDEQVSVRAPVFNDAETNRRERPSHDNLEELRNQRYSVFDSPPPDTLGKPSESIFVPALTPRLSDPERFYVEEETALARKTASSPDSFAYSARDDVAGIELACLTQLKSDEDVGKNKNLGSLRSKGRESTHNSVTETVELPTFITPLSHKRHTVTFASPIESLMLPDVRVRATTKSDRSLQRPVEPFGKRRPWRQEGGERKNDRIVWGERLKTSYTSKDDAPLPMPVPSKDRKPRNKGTNPLIATATETTVLKAETASNAFAAHEAITDGVDVHDIVEVLDDIHAVITTSIAKRFENMRKDVRACRGELLQDVLQDLKITVATNVEQFNNLVQLEEEYYEYYDSMTRRWEELIHCNESVLSHFKNAVKDHDRSISAKTYPTSILPRKPLFSDFKDRLML
ncbi:hypothetical protein F5J12DRAFT_804704 [Pisolithus orientalis]|uniref:uncharacterized protein n=1 Tax=Pisolithus orientalis TaxID=936130 RepID=UPI002223F1D2|nr:uncharacterized protein F5J12DRAFT_804704 [Pisolithus orientalis]KAI6028343.1 hypothetical protein F5J12DRAFT_804704 [Pisolithus orientalis]